MRWRKKMALMYLIPLIVLSLTSFTLINPRFPLIRSVHATPETMVSVSPSNTTDLTLTPETTLTLRPNGDVAAPFDEWTGTPTDTYQDWDDITPDETSYFWTDTAAEFQSSTLQDSTTQTWNISKVKVIIVANGTSNSQVKPILTIGGFPFLGATYNLTTAYSTYTSEWGMNPATYPYEYWTWDDIDTLQAGVYSQRVEAGSEIRVTQIYVEVSGPRLTVDIRVEDVEDLWGWQFELSYDPDIIQGVYPDEYALTPFVLGPFLGSAGIEDAGGSLGTAAGAGWNNTYGKLFLTMAYIVFPGLPDPTLCPDGEGVLATLIFTVVGKGETNLRFGRLTSLKDPWGEWIVQGLDYVEDGYFRNVDTADMPTASFTYSPIDTPVPLEGYNVTLTDTSTAAAGRTIEKRKWYLWRKYRDAPSPLLDGPVITTTATTATYNYTMRGTWRLTLTVFDDQDVSNTITGYVVIKAHDVFFADIKTNTSRTAYPYGYNFTEIDKTLQVDVTAKNEGNFTETFNVTCFWSALILGKIHYETIGTQYGITLAAGANTTLQFYWDTTGCNLTHPDYYTLHANASAVPYEWDKERMAGKIADNEFLCSDPIRPILHNIAVTKVTTDATTPITPGDTVEVSVTVVNEGDFNETDISVTAYYDEYEIDTKMIHLMTNRTFAEKELPTKNDTIKIYFYWDTTPGPPSTYRISAKASLVSGEYDPSDNTLTDGKVRWPEFPEASFTYEPSEPVVDQTVTFDASASNDPEEDPLSYGWDFGDGEVGNGVTVDHEYEDAGTYNVTLTVSDGLHVDVEKKTVIVYPVPIHDINVTSVTAAPAYPPNWVTAGDLVTINVDVLNEGNVKESFGVNVYYNSSPIEVRPSVTLGAGASRTLAFIWNTVGVYPANYTINVTVPPVEDEEDTGDNTASFSSVAFTGPPKASFTYSPAEPVVGQTITFNASDSTPDGGVLTDPDSYAWDFNSDGTIDAYGMIVTHNYTATGTYTVTLNVTDSEGESDETAQSVTVSAAPDTEDPVADAGPNQTVDVNTTVTFNAGGSTDNVGIVSYEWDFDDGTSPVTEANPVTTHIYTEIGTYTVTLTVSDAVGNTDTDTLTVTVREPAPPFEVPIWLIIVVVVVVIGVVLAVVLLRRRG